MYILEDEPVLIDRRVCFGPAEYEYRVRSGAESWQDFQRHLKTFEADAFILIADSGVSDSFIAQTEQSLAAVARTITLTLNPSESAKRLSTVDYLADQAIARGVSRRTVVVALGGGIVGNVAGLLAALLFRGIRLIHVPTTLLGMSDSTLSLKQGVNSSSGKNMLGTFHKPALVWNNLDFLAALPPDHIRAALCEAIKNVLVIAPERYDDIAGWLRPDADYSPARLADFIDLCVAAKSSVMAHDGYEKGDALVLEYGHTVGHAVELLSNGRLSHGFAVGLGMLVAARISRQLGYLSAADEAAHRDLLILNGAPTKLIDGLEVEAILDLCQRDNKRGYVECLEGHIEFILLTGLGKSLRCNGSLINSISEPIVRNAIWSLVDKNG